MNDNEAHDLLIRIDASQVDMTRRLGLIEGKLEQRLCHTNAEKIRKLEEKAGLPLPCQTNTEKIKTHEKFIVAAIMASLIATVKSFWFGGAS
jgi:hypothetical protein